MFMFAAAISLSVFAAEPEIDLAKLQAELGIPQIEFAEYRVHVAKRGKWTIRETSIYNFKGVDEDEIANLKEELMQDCKTRKTNSNFSTAHSLDDDRWQLKAKGKSDDVLSLASTLNEMIARGGKDCTYFCWDQHSLVLKYDFREEEPVAIEWPWLGDRPDHVVYNVLAQIVVGLALEAAGQEYLRSQNISQDGLEKAVGELKVDTQLMLTTVGKITADAPAEVSEDGKTMTLDLWNLIADPPKTWSIRIDGL